MPCLFCQFVAGKKKKSVNGFPFQILHQTKNTLSFLSTDIPANKGGHTLVIPKKHFKKIENIPKKVLHELIDHVQLTAKVLKKYHPGCNILLNNSKEAGQVIPHVHFHVIPRDKNDGIKVEIWKKAKINQKEFEKMSSRLKKTFQGLK